jgi:glycerophosphoryl diester phosphodiesterase
MNSERSGGRASRGRRGGALLGLWGLCCASSACEFSGDAHVPMFSDGGLLRQGQALTRDQLYGFEGLFTVNDGTDLFGDDLSLRTSPGTVSLLTDKDAGFAVLGAACLPDQRVVIEGYWQYPTRIKAGLVRLFVDPPEAAATLCAGGTLTPSPELQLTGYYGRDDNFPNIPLSLGWAHDLKPWRGRFFTVAHHGACEATDHCGVANNSIETARLAERTGSNALEIDVRTTRDGIPVLFHDPGLSSALVRGLFCNGSIADLSLAELRANCSLAYGEVLPTVEEMMDVVINETELEAVYLDMKVPEGVLPVARLVSKILTDLEERNSNADPSDDRTIAMVVAITTDEVRSAWHEAKSTLEAEGLRVPSCLLEYDPNLVLSEGCVAWGPTWTAGLRISDVQRLRAAGVATVFWTINQSDFIDDFLKRAQPNGIITGRGAMLFHRYQTIGTVPDALGEMQ